MKHTHRPAPTQYENYTFSALATEELESLIRLIREEGYTSPEHMDVLRQAEAKLIDRKEEVI